MTRSRGSQAHVVAKPRRLAAPAAPERENGRPAEPDVVPLPAELKAELRRLLAEALAQDYLADHGGLRQGDGNVAVGNADPSEERQLLSDAGRGDGSGRAQ